MRLSIGYRFDYRFAGPTPVIALLNVHYTRISDLEQADPIIVSPAVELSAYRDGFGNWCSRFVAPAGQVTIAAKAVIRDSGLREEPDQSAGQVPLEMLPDECLTFLIPSRFCDSDRFVDLAWELFGKAEPGYARVQAVCDFVHQHLAFDYQDASAYRSASDAYQGRKGVCRDFAHLAVAFCRALNIPARYCTCYLSDLGTPPPYPPGDFAASFEAYLSGGWQMFDPRNNEPRIGRILIARGRDAADVAMLTTFGAASLVNFKVWCDQLD